MLRNRKIAIIGAIAISVVLLGVGGSMFFGGEDQEGENAPAKPEVTVARIEPGLKRTFTVTGEATALKSATITGEFAADVQEIYVKPGDTVKKGQLLVRLSDESVQERYATAGASYTTAAENISRTQESNQRNIEAARITLENAQNTYEAVLKQNDAKRKQAQETFNAATLNFDLGLEDAKNDLQTDINSTDNKVEEIVADLDRILEFSPLRTDLNYVYEIHIGVRDPAQKQKTRDAFQDTLNLVQTYVPSYENAIALLTQLEKALIMARTTLNNSVTAVDYDQDDLDAHITTVNTSLGIVRGLMSSLKTNKIALDKAELNTGTESQTIINARVQLEATLADLNASELSAKQQVDQARASLETAIASANISETSARSTLNSVSGELRQTRVSYDKLTIEAPFDGVVASVPVRVGDEVANGTQLVRIEFAEQLKIVASVSTEEARNLHVGDPVRIGDAISSITAIAPSADPVTKKHEVEILHEDTSIQAGTFVDVTFTARSSDIAGDTRIFVPVTAVQISAAETFVWTIKRQDGETVVHKSPVSISTVIGDRVQIASGLVPGELLVIDGGRNITQEVPVIVKNMDIPSRNTSNSTGSGAMSNDTTSSEQ